MKVLSYFRKEFSKLKEPLVMALMGLFIGLGIVFTRILRPVELPYLRISFGFIATAASAMILGPVLGGINAALTDIAGFFLFPSPGGAFFPGLTISAFLTAVIYGIFLHNKKIKLGDVVISVLIVTVFIDMLLNTYWLTILLGKVWGALFPLRALKAALWYPVQVIVLFGLSRLQSRMPMKIKSMWNES